MMEKKNAQIREEHREAAAVFLHGEQACSEGTLRRWIHDGQDLRYGRASVGQLAQLLANWEEADNQRWAAALDRADWDGGVFHHEGRLYPWPRGFVPDCPATWRPKVEKAVLAERERCATLLEARAKAYENAGCDSSHSLAMLDMAAKVRADPNEKPKPPRCPEAIGGFQCEREQNHRGFCTAHQDGKRWDFKNRARGE